MREAICVCLWILHLQILTKSGKEISENLNMNLVIINVRFNWNTRLRLSHLILRWYTIDKINDFTNLFAALYVERNDKLVQSHIGLHEVGVLWSEQHFI